MTSPSEIPPEGRALESQEFRGLVGEMAAIIESSHLFKSLDDDGRRRMLESGYVVSYAKGETIIRQGAPGETLYIVLDGRVRIETESAAGPVHLAELGRGACIGEVSVLTGQPRTANVTAISDIDLVAFQKHRIERILDDYPKVRELLQSLVEGRARDTIEKIVGS